jgi:hypothetical protein
MTDHTREDLLTEPERSRLKVGSPFSRNSLREDLEVSFDTVSRWLAALMELYYAFEIRPFTKRVARSLKKEGKLSLWDWSEVEAEGPRFENLVACHLLKACDFWTDTGEGTFDLCLLRNREKEEIDFLIVRDGKPWLPVEARASETAPAPHWRKFLRYLSTPVALQICATPTVWEQRRIDGTTLLVASADEVLRYLV